MCFVGLSVYWIWSDLSKRNLAVRQSTGMEKKASDWGEWMSTVITCTRVKVKIKVKVKVKEKGKAKVKEKKASDCGEWMSTVITFTKVNIKVKVKVKGQGQRQGQGQGEEGLRLGRVDVHSDHLHQG